MAYRCGIVGLCPNPNIECKECEYYSEPLFDDEDDDEYWSLEEEKVTGNE